MQTISNLTVDELAKRKDDFIISNNERSLIFSVILAYCEELRNKYKHASTMEEVLSIKTRWQELVSLLGALGYKEDDNNLELLINSI